MKKVKLAIFDMDGTLYQFLGGGAFRETSFGRAVQQNARAFIAQEFELDEIAASERYEQISLAFNGEISLGLERQFGIDRMRFFETTWSLDPAEFIIPEPDMRGTIEQVGIERALLSAAPRIWVDRVLDFLDIKDLFEDRIFTGEPDIRKPNPLAFQQILDLLGVEAGDALSIGDQEHTDILPALSLGMRTLRIGGHDVASEAEFRASTLSEAINTLQKGGIV